MQQIQLTETQNKVIVEFDKLSPRKAVIELPTAFGKTVIAIELIKKYNYKRMLIVANTTHLVSQWENELIKYKININDSIITTIQSACKFKKYDFDLLIIDEGHHSVAPKFVELLENNKFKNIIILTSELIRDDMRHLLLKQFKIKIISNKSYEQGIKEKLISDFQIINISVKLIENEIIQYEKINNFIRENYKKFNYNFLEVKMQAYSNYLATELLLCFNKRKELLNNAFSKQNKVKEILENNLWSKTIIYCEYISNANSLYELLKHQFSCCIYHSEIKDKEKVLEDFKTNKFKIIIAVKSLDEGLNIPDLDFAIIMSSSKQERQRIQRIGRLLRYKEGKVATIYNLYCENTKEEDWLRESLKSFDKEKIFWR